MAMTNPLISATKFLLLKAEAHASPLAFSKLLDGSDVESVLAKSCGQGPRSNGGAVLAHSGPTPLQGGVGPG